MTRHIINEELHLISQVEPRNAKEACNDDHELDQILKNDIWD